MSRYAHLTPIQTETIITLCKDELKMTPAANVKVISQFVDAVLDGDAIPELLDFLLAVYGTRQHRDNFLGFNPCTGEDINGKETV